jgi:hypothetical protein
LSTAPFVNDKEQGVMKSDPKAETSNQFCSKRNPSSIQQYFQSSGRCITPLRFPRASNQRTQQKWNATVHRSYCSPWDGRTFESPEPEERRALANEVLASHRPGEGAEATCRGSMPVSSRMPSLKRANYTSRCRRTESTGLPSR